MTAAEVRDLVAKSESRICGRLYKRTDGTVLTKDCPVGLRAYQKRVARFAGAALATILGLFSVSFGQKADEKTVDASVDASKVKIVKTISRENILSGTIVDSSGAVIHNAEIALRKGKILVSSMHSGEDGTFSFLSLMSGNFSLEDSSPGFENLTVKNLELGDDEKSQINLNFN